MSKRCALPQPAAPLKPAGQDLTEILTRAVLNSPTAVVITGADGTIEYVNRKFSALTGYAPAEAIGRQASLLKSGLMPKSVYRTLWRHLKKGEEWAGEFHNRKKSGECYWEQASISPVRDAAGRLRHYLKMAEDISERKRLEAELRASFDALRAREARLQATCLELAAATRALTKSQSRLQRLSQEDALTGLLNRRGFYSELRRAKALAQRQGHALGFLIIDIDHFKLINDAYGHSAGDRILKACARLFQSRLRTSDLICRYGGDEIVIALPAAGINATLLTAERILAAVRKHTFSAGRAKIPVTVSIGAACGIPAPSQSLDHVMGLADQALYRVKRNGRNGVAFASFGDAQAPEELTAPQPCRPVFNLPLALLDARDPATGAHCRRVAQMAGVLARALELPAEQIDLITQSALLHDIGKVAVPDAVLLKAGPLTAAERLAVQTHSRAGQAWRISCPDLKALAEIVLSHHERLDGSGYPRGLKGRRIGAGARILAVADTYDAMRAGRPYAPPRSAAEALREIRRARGALFAPDVVDALARCQGELEAVLAAGAPARGPLTCAGQSSAATPRDRSRR